jgi:hypothetical protein
MRRRLQRSRSRSLHRRQSRRPWANHNVLAAPSARRRRASPDDHSAPAYDGPARDVTARTNDRGSAHRAATAYRDSSTSCADLDYRAVLLELLLE